jgi:hypothetical protein
LVKLSNCGSLKFLASKLLYEELTFDSKVTLVLDAIILGSVVLFDGVVNENNPNNKTDKIL